MGMWGRSRFSCSDFRGDLGIIIFFNLQTSCIFLLKTIKKTTPALDVVFQAAGLGRKKSTLQKGVVLPPYLVLDIDLSIFSLTHKDLRRKSKTVPISFPPCANYLPSFPAGKNCSKIAMLSFAVYPQRTELKASMASRRLR